MKRILIPTDFSECALNATKYAFKIAEVTGASVFMFHANHIPFTSPDVPITFYDDVVQSSENAVYEKIEQLKTDVLTQLNINSEEINFQPIVKLGFAVDEILNLVTEKNIDLIVMGTKGASGLKKQLLGTITESVMKESTCPVLVIPEKSQYRNFKKILLAVDFNNALEEKSLLPLMEISNLYNSELLIFNVKPEEAYVPTADEALEGLKLENSIKNIPHDYFFSENENTEEAIDEFIDTNEIDLLVMLPHKHTLFEKIFGKSLTSEMAFHTKVPLLTLPKII